MMYNRVSRCCHKSCLALLALLCLSGCSIFGVAADKLSGDPTVAAEYVPQKDFMLVLVESYKNPSSVSITSEQLDRQIAGELVEHKVAPIINPDRLSDLRQRAPKKFQDLDIAAMGRSFGAKQVLYVDVQDFNVESAIGSQMVKANANARVRVIDAATGRTLWPMESKAGYPVSFQTPYVALREGVTESTVRDHLTTAFSDRVAKLFFESKAEEVDQMPQLSGAN